MSRPERPSCRHRLAPLREKACTWSRSSTTASRLRIDVDPRGGGNVARPQRAAGRRVEADDLALEAGGTDRAAADHRRPDHVGDAFDLGGALAAAIRYLPSAPRPLCRPSATIRPPGRPAYAVPGAIAMAAGLAQHQRRVLALEGPATLASVGFEGRNAIVAGAHQHQAEADDRHRHGLARRVARSSLLAVTVERDQAAIARCHDTRLPSDPTPADSLRLPDRPATRSGRWRRRFERPCRRPTQRTRCRRPRPARTRRRPGRTGRSSAVRAATGAVIAGGSGIGGFSASDHGQKLPQPASEASATAAATTRARSRAVPAERVELHLDETPQRAALLELVERELVRRACVLGLSLRQQQVAAAVGIGAAKLPADSIGSSFRPSS